MATGPEMKLSVFEFEPGVFGFRIGLGDEPLAVSVRQYTNKLALIADLSTMCHGISTDSFIVYDETDSKAFSEPCSSP